MRIPVFSVTAYSGTGKTTMLERLISQLCSFGYRVAAIKHDAHSFEIDREGKDSYRLTAAGASVTALVSETKTAVIYTGPVKVEEIIESIRDVDVILTEGYKHGIWPKIGLARLDAGGKFTVNPDECFAVMSDFPVTTCTSSFHLDDIEGIAKLIISEITRQSEKRDAQLS